MVNTEAFLLSLLATIPATIAFTAPAAQIASWIPHTKARCKTLALSPSDDWGMEEDPRIEAMRSMLENSWNGREMGTVPSSPEKAAEAAAEAVALAMGQSHNVLMIDLRLPSYDITEGPRLYDKKAVYDFCTNLSLELRTRKLITKSLVLVRNEEERRDTERASEISRQASESMDNLEDEVDDDSINEFDDSGDSEVAEFRKKLMNSWDDSSATTTSTESDMQMKPTKKAITKPRIDPNSSHRLWSMVGNEEISTGSDMFDQVIEAADKNARLRVEEQEDALIIISPYDTADVIAVRRILARYGQTRTIIIVNSRMETLPVELNSAVLVYGVMPLVARSRSEEDEEGEAGLRVVVMKRFPKDWGMFIDIDGDGFVPVSDDKAGRPRADSKDFPPPEWIVSNVQAHVEGLSQS